jgi:hypothetical protein
VVSNVERTDMSEVVERSDMDRLDIDDVADMQADAVFARLRGSPDGLSSTEAADWFDRYGPNELAVETVNPCCSCCRSSGDPSRG